jgi:hypothetical protein
MSLDLNDNADMGSSTDPAEEAGAPATVRSPVAVTHLVPRRSQRGWRRSAVVCVSIVAEPPAVSPRSG